MNNIIAFDPGVTTGWATLTLSGYHSGQLEGDLTVVYNELNWFNSRSSTPPKVLYEQFKHRPQLMNAELYSVRVLGVIDLWCAQHDIEPAFTPMPAQAKAFWSDDKIKMLNLWRPGYGHAMDALRVLLTYRAKYDPEWYHEALKELRG